MPPENNSQIHDPVIPARNISIKILIAFSALIFVSAFLMLIRTPSDFPQKAVIEIGRNSTVSQIAHNLKEENIISSVFFFKAMVRIFNPDHGVISGTYYFNHPVSGLNVARRVSNGDYDMELIKFTIPEGSNVFQTAEIVSRFMPNISETDFIEKGRSEEGYLFPDTYSFLPSATADEVISKMRENFDKRIAGISAEISNFGKPLDDIIKMASYLEEEARLMETRRIVAGILWNRLAIGMALQIDSSFQYVNGKNTYELSREDLQIDSKYNTYKYNGHTPTPLSSPGLDAIKAAINPIKSKYLYFLTDHDGNMHYAETLDEHNVNKARYLK